MHVDDVVEAIFQRLCIRQQDSPPDADRSMSLVELRLALGVTEALLNEALWLLTFPDGATDLLGVIAGGLLAAPLAAEALPAPRNARIGYLATNLATTPHL